MRPDTETPLQTLPADATNLNSPSPVNSSPVSQTWQKLLTSLINFLPLHGDAQTIAGGWRELFTMLFNSFFICASLLEPFSPSNKKTPLGYSLFSTIVGGALASIIAICSAKIQAIVDELNEQDIEKMEEKIQSALASSHATSPERDLSCFEWAYEKIANYLTMSGKLTSLQVLQLAMARLGQICDLAGFGIGLLNSPHSSLSLTEKTLFNFLILLAATPLVEAALRPARNAMLLNRNEARNIRRGGTNPNQNADHWTISFIMAKLLQAFIANTNFCGSLYDKMNDKEADTPFGVSSEGIKYTILPIIYVTVSVALLQYFVSVMNQGFFRKHKNKTTVDAVNHHVINQIHQDNSAHPRLPEGNIEKQLINPNPEDTRDNSFSEQNGNIAILSSVTKETQAPQPITSLEKTLITLFLIGRMVGTATDCSVALLLLLGGILSRPAYLGAAVGGTAVGTIMCTSDWRTNEQYYQAWRKLNAPTIDAVIESIEKKASRVTSNIYTLFSCVCPSTPSSIDRDNLLSNEHKV